ncbi:Rab GTPase domain-containing protein [Tieghemostelium lacteum]|uniref:Rab GTPase domain-containing protein n=1 Tax=Tieghemostelium lacteum TaxID=361077 RepID=A0A151Z3K8_TIELA|nr:Rab GTPase domain-containing protein [Tieghemostelium lacteum]|eukprot:KYQ88546.1 Rab GTPase domain-containing protein [Tieghemostelium lacteum]
MGNENGRILSEDYYKENLGVIDGELKRKLNNKLIKYNVKLVIKGDRNTGKTSLFNRLQGLPFTTDYSPTPEIKVSHINWNYKNTDDIVDVEVWDVVDVAKKQQVEKKPELKLSQQQQQSNGTNTDVTDDIDLFYQDFDPKKLVNGSTKSGSFKFQSLDASTLNVYKRANAVLFMVDPSKKWTFTYVENELKKVPNDLFVLLITNYRDKNPIGIGSGNSQSILTKIEIDSLCETRKNMYHVEASMLNAFGLKSIVTFLNLPFLYAQKLSLQRQLERNEIEFASATEEVSFIIKEQSYDGFIINIEAKKQLQQQQQQPSPPLNSVSKSQPNLSNLTNSVQTQPNLPPPISKSQPNINSQTQQQPPQPVPSTNTTPVSTSGGFFSRLTKSIGLSSNNSNNSNNTATTTTNNSNTPQSKQPTQPQQQQVVLPTKITSVDEFAISSPNTNGDDDFYSDKPKSSGATGFIKNLVTKPTPTTNNNNNNNKNNDKFGDSDDDDDFNPLVSKIDDEDEDEVFTQMKKPVSKPVSKPSSKPSKTTTTEKQKLETAKTTTTPVKVEPTKPVSPPKEVTKPSATTPTKSESTTKVSSPTTIKSSGEMSKPTTSPLSSSPKVTSQPISVLKSSGDVKPPLSSSPKVTSQPVSVLKSSGDVKPPTTPTKTTTVTSSKVTPPKSKSEVKPKKKQYQSFDDDEDEEEDNPFVTKDEKFGSDDEEISYQPVKPIKTQTKVEKSNTKSEYQSFGDDDEDGDNNNVQKDDIPPPPSMGNENLDDWFDD